MANADAIIAEISSLKTEFSNTKTDMDTQNEMRNTLNGNVQQKILNIEQYINSLNAQVGAAHDELKNIRSECHMMRDNMGKGQGGQERLKRRDAEKHIPEKFTGDQKTSPFTDFQFAMENFLTILDPLCDAKDLLNWAASNKEIITRNIVAMKGQREPD